MRKIRTVSRTTDTPAGGTGGSGLSVSCPAQAALERSVVEANTRAVGLSGQEPGAANNAVSMLVPRSRGGSFTPC
ncbi:MAG: hypothetical protein JNM07_00270 [Phycisphaerae bacterium]|nr:hypothetical protein [Phycisphaerae bacterium]